VNHFATPEFWTHFRRLPVSVQGAIDRALILLRSDPRHPSLHFKKVGVFWSIRVGLNYRALAKERKEGWVWFWVGPHDRYSQLIRS